ncbi:hypothetical protein EPN42_10280 [bacterium]|nr:MAG: hypothetical protein EPN42_10280 [bacterium]
MARYLFIIEDTPDATQEAKYFLNARQDVINWVALLPGTFFVESYTDIFALSNDFRSYRIKNGGEPRGMERYAFFEFNLHAGWLNKVAWDAIAEAGTRESFSTSLQALLGTNQTNPFNAFLPKPPKQ